MMFPHDACHTTSQLSIQGGKHLDTAKNAVRARSRSTSAGSSAGGSPGSNSLSTGASPDCQGAVRMGPPALSTLDHQEAFFDIGRHLLLGGSDNDDSAAPRGICLPPGLEDATPAARALVPLQDNEHDDYGEDAFGWIVASSAAEMVLGSPMSASGKSTSSVLVEAIDISPPILLLDKIIHSGTMQIPRAPRIPPLPLLQAPVLGLKEGLKPSCAPPAQVPMQDHERDDYDEDAFAWAVASSAAELALSSPTSASGKSAPLVEVMDISSPIFSLDTFTPHPPPLQAPAFGSKSLAASCGPLAKDPTFAPQTKPPACAPPTQPPLLSTHTNFQKIEPPAQPPIVVAHMQRSSILPPPVLPPTMSGRLEELQFLPLPMLPPSLLTCRPQPPLALPPCQPPLLRAEMQQHLANSPCRPPMFRAEMQPPVDVPPPTQAPILRIAEAVQAPAIGTSASPSVGSGGHHLGTCRPCAFFHSKGCGNGAECQFCHLCTPGEKKRRMKDKRRGEGEQLGQGA